MGFSLGWHIILASLGVAFPALIVAAEWRGMRRGDPVALLLARRWARTFAVLLAVGAVSGTIISFEMGLLWRAGQCLPAARPGTCCTCR
jgi:cytochrome d ubiquinol oxidase subunit I